MSTKDVSQLTTTKVPGQITHDTTQAIRRYKELTEFDYELTDTTQQIRLFGRDSKGIRLTYKVKDSSDLYNAVRYYEVKDEWLIDLTTSVIDETGFIGGILDGSTIDIGSDYLIWAFFDDTGSIFRGFGATRRPNVIYTSTSVITGTPGDKGSETRFNLSGTGNNNGIYFVIGSEVQIYNSDDETAEYNHGIVIATTTTTVDILLDDSTQYGSANISVIPGLILQSTNLKPLDINGDRYNDLFYKYVCNLQISDNLDIINVRRRGDRYFFLSNFIADTSTFAGGTQTTLIEALRFLPKHSENGVLMFHILDGNNIIYSVGPEFGNVEFLSQARPNKESFTHSTVNYNKYTKNWIGTKTGGSPTNDLQTFLQGYDGENEF